MIQRPHVQPYLFACLACLTLVASAAYDLYRERIQAIQTAGEQTAALTRLLEEALQQLFRRADLELDEVTQSPSSANLVLPADGVLRAAQVLAPEPGRDDEWRTRLLQATPGVLQVDRLRRAGDGPWRLMVGKLPVVQAGGAKPAWQAQLNLEPLQRLLDTADTRHNGFATLFTRDGWLLATAPRNDALAQRNWGDAPMFVQHLPRAPQGTVQQVVVRDGTERLYSYRTLGSYPLVISAGISLTDALAAWRQRLAGHSLLIALVSAAFFAGAHSMSRSIRRREQAQQALVDARQHAERSESFLRTITDNLPLRIAYLDLARRYRFVNLAQCRHLALPRESILGRTDGELGTPTASPVFTLAMERGLQGQAQNIEIEEATASGRRVWATLLAPERDDSGLVVGLYAASLDVSEQFEQRQRLDLALKERETLLREIYHRVKNNLQVIQSLLRLQRRGLSDPAAQQALDDSASRVHAMALVHEKLYRSASLEAVSLPEYTHELLQHLGETTGASARGVKLHADVVGFEARIDAAIPYGLLVNELVSNGLKHGFAARASGNVWLTVERAGPGLRLTVRDDGAGFQPGFSLDADASMGLQLAASLAAQLGGMLTVQAASGAVLMTEMPAFAVPAEKAQEA